jgi:heme-degrading monooxygenase HmoA
MPVVSITRLRVRSWGYFLPFIVYALRSSRQAKHSRGNLGVSLLRDTDRTFWTRTVWTTESAMKGFMLAGVHRQVMRKLLEWCDEAALVHWEQESDHAPDWAEAHQRLQAQGRPSKVNHPSPAHASFQIRPPVF